MVDRSNVNQYELNGSRDYSARAAEVIDEKLEDYELEPLSPDLHQEIRSIISSSAEGVDASDLPSFA